MFKKYILPVVLMATLMLGNFSIQPVAASASHKDQHQEKIQIHISGMLKELRLEDVDDYVQWFQFFKEKLNQIQWYQHKPKNPSYDKEKEQIVVPKPDKPTKPSTPVERPTQPEEQPKVEEPKEEQAPEQPKVEEEEDLSKEEVIPELSAFEQEVIQLTNAERAKAGLQSLQVDIELSYVAREKSKDMATIGYFDHNSPTYGSPFDMMRAYGITYQSAGENIAKGQRTPQEVVQAWMNSTGHRENIMNPNFTHIGVGHVESGNYWTQMFISK